MARNINARSFLFLVGFYRPHPKDDGRLCFHRRLSVNWGGGEVPHLAFTRGVPPSGLHPGGTPSGLHLGNPIQPSSGGYPIWPSPGSTPSSLHWGGGGGGGVTHLTFTWGVTPSSPMGVLHLWMGVLLGTPPPHQAGWGTRQWAERWDPPLPRETEQHSEYLLRGGRCLLLSRRRTFFS